MTNKRYGRVGDSPIIGASTWADDRCAVSGTGWGEITTSAPQPPTRSARGCGWPAIRWRAADRVINQDIPKAGGDGGAIAALGDGSVIFPFNTGGMYRGWIGADGVPHVAIYKTDAGDARALRPTCVAGAPFAGSSLRSARPRRSRAGPAPRASSGRRRRAPAPTGILALAHHDAVAARGEPTRQRGVAASRWRSASVRQIAVTMLIPISGPSPYCLMTSQPPTSSATVYGTRFCWNTRSTRR